MNLFFHYSFLDEMSNNPRRFTNLQLIAKLNDCIERVLKEGGIYGPEDAVFRLCLSLFLLVKTTRTGLTPRSGPAPIYLAWNYIEKMESLQMYVPLCYLQYLMQ